MLKKELFEDIKSNLIKYPLIKPRKHMNQEDVIDLLIIYNYNTYNKFLLDCQLGINNPTEEISDNLINKFKEYIDDYFLKTTPHDIDLREFTKYISLYITYILNKPLHPIAKISTHYEIKKDNNQQYLCKMRVDHIGEDDSLCRFCVCKSL